MHKKKLKIVLRTLLNLLAVVDYISIENTLLRLDTEYNASIADPDMPIFFSKLAVIELSGWLEDSVDDILYEYIGQHLLDSDVIDPVKDIIQKNYGFKYSSNILKICLSVLGANNWENIVDKLKPVEYQNLKTITGSLTNSRNKAAHTSSVVTRTFNAPSSTLADFRKLKPSIQIIEREVKMM